MSVGLDPKTCSPPLRPAEAGGWDHELEIADLPRPIHFSSVFGRTAPLEIEVGFGSGLYMAEQAARHPECNFFGIEKDGKQVRRAKDKWRRRGLLNVRALCCDAFYFLEEFVSPGAVDRYTILFSDPWFKKRHHKRRVFSPRLLPVLERTLRPAGLLAVKTDVTPYYDVIRKTLDSAPFLQRLYDKRLDLEPEVDDIVTNYQRKAMEKGHPIHSLLYRRTG